MRNNAKQKDEWIIEWTLQSGYERGRCLSAAQAPSQRELAGRQARLREFSEVRSSAEVRGVRGHKETFGKFSFFPRGPLYSSKLRRGGRGFPFSRKTVLHGKLWDTLSALRAPLPEGEAGFQGLVHPLALPLGELARQPCLRG